MGLKLACGALVAGAALQACSPATEPKPEAAAPAVTGAEAITPQNPFFGAWALEGARIAPWWDRKGEEPAPDPALAKITFGAEKSSGSQLLACDKPKYAVNVVSPRMLLEGNLPDPAKDAALEGPGVAAAGLADADQEQCEEADEHVRADAVVEAVVDGA